MDKMSIKQLPDRAKCHLHHGRMPFRLRSVGEHLATTKSTGKLLKDLSHGISLVALGVLVLMWYRMALGKTFGRFRWRLKGSLGKRGS